MQATYFHDELSTLEVAFKDIMANTLSLPLHPGSSKCLRGFRFTRRNDIKTALKRMSPDGSAADVIKQFVTASLSPIAILEFFNTASRTLDILVTRMWLLHCTPPAAHEGARRYGLQCHGGHLPRDHRVHHRAGRSSH